MPEEVTPLVEQFKARLALPQRDQLGEGPVWDAAQNRLLWGDHASGIIREARPDGAGGWRESKRWTLNRPLAAAIPRIAGGLIVAGGTEIVQFAEDGTCTPFARIDTDSPLIRINDAKCDAQGRLWAATLSSDFRPGAAALYRIDPDRSVRKMLGGVTLGNGLDWSPDGAVFYLVDSFIRTLFSFDFDAKRGEISNQRRLVTLTRGVPNGMAVDRSGCLWVAATGGGNVQRYSRDGNYLATVEIATPGATSCAFGGSDGAELLITSRAGRMPEAALQMGVDPKMMDNDGPEAGGLFVCRTGATGAPAHAFAG